MDNNFLENITLATLQEWLAERANTFLDTNPHLSLSGAINVIKKDPFIAEELRQAGLFLTESLPIDSYEPAFLDFKYLMIATYVKEFDRKILN